MNVKSPFLATHASTIHHRALHHFESALHIHSSHVIRIAPLFSHNATALISLQLLAITAHSICSSDFNSGAFRHLPRRQTQTLRSHCAFEPVVTSVSGTFGCLTNASALDK